MKDETTLSKIAVAENGSVIKLPKNFDKLSQSKQRQVVLAALRDEMIQITSLASNQRVLKEKIKLQNSLIRNSKEYKELMKMKKQLKEDARLEYDLLGEWHGMKKLAFKLGLIKEEDVKSIVLIENQGE
ncbi:MAG: hypothetical protein AMXMBFR51_20830 [Ignavibacteriota bacterium]